MNFRASFFVTILFFVQSAQSMELMNTTADNGALWEVMLTHGKQCFSHEMITSCAVNKTLNRVLLATATMRKGYLQEVVLQQNKYYAFQDPNVWHKYGSAYGKQVKSSHPGDLWLARLELADCCLGYLIQAKCWDNFHGALPYSPKPFFNVSNDLCFYGYGTVQMNGKYAPITKSNQVIKYSLSSKGDMHALSCITDATNLEMFLDFPVLLKAFLHSSKVVDAKKMLSGGFVVARVYRLDGVTIPDDYTTYKQYSENSVYKSYDDLPEDVKSSILMRKVAYKK